MSGSYWENITQWKVAGNISRVFWCLGSYSNLLKERKNERALSGNQNILDHVADFWIKNDRRRHPLPDFRKVTGAKPLREHPSIWWLWRNQIQLAGWWMKIAHMCQHAINRRINNSKVIFMCLPVAFWSLPLNVDTLYYWLLFVYVVPDHHLPP